jgi:Na+/H+-dicarboxylate symporter
LENLNRNDSRVTIWIINEELGTKRIVVDWIKPFGTIFINLLKMIAVPLIVVSLIVGLADLKDISKLSKLGGRTVLFYLCSTVVTIGLGLANLIKPGRFINKESRESLIQNFSVDASQKIEMAASAKRMVLFNRLLISFQIIFSKL